MRKLELVCTMLYLLIVFNLGFECQCLLQFHFEITLHYNCGD